MSIRIITDSTADIGVERVAAWGVTVVPLKVIFGEDEYRDGVDITLDEFYKRLVKEDVLPTTSQPAPEAFLEIFEQARDAGDWVVVITISSNISGTYQSACLAKQLSKYENIYIIDSRQVTLSAQLMVKRAVDLRDGGADAETIYRTIEAEKTRYRLYAVIGDLTYLEKGGRLSKVGAAAGSILNLKPVITITTDGVVKLAGMARGTGGAYSKLFKLVEADGGMTADSEFIIGYTGSRDTLEPFEKYVSQRIDMKNSMESRIGTVIGTHGGPGCVVLGCMLNHG